MSAFDQRGRPLRLHTTWTAEQEIALERIPDTVVERIGRNLREVPISPRDRTVGAIRIRESEGYDVMFLHSETADAFVITVGSIMRPDPKKPMEKVLEGLELVATFRSALKF
jgi:hypothetical protein